jgi:hypothetical protein
MKGRFIGIMDQVLQAPWLRSYADTKGKAAAVLGKRDVLPDWHRRET